MTIRYLKELIKDLPDDMRIHADNGISFFDGEEFLCGFVVCKNISDERFVSDKRFILQTRKDLNVKEELEGLCDYAVENNIDDYDFWNEVSERGFKPSDFDDLEWATINYNMYVNGMSYPDAYDIYRKEVLNK